MEHSTAFAEIYTIRLRRTSRARATGLWLFRMDGFQGWKGGDWGMPNISSAQHRDNGPVKPPTVF